MKIRKPKGTIKLTLITLLIITSILGCKNRDTKNTSMNSEDKQVIIKQDKGDLLNGVSRAVCYSGFRNGQHPDRGDGAINPTYNQVLEDLQILSYKSNFKLIRIYDSGENSDMVLRVIRENNMDIKVLLGIWLRAELSNHETCEWLHEPIPEEILQKNKAINSEEIQRGIKLANEYQDIVVAVNVGNEALVDWNDHKVNVDTIISYVKRVKSAIKQPVTVADNYKWWADNGTDLAAVVDFVSVHTYPVWEGKDINEGMPYTIENIKEVRNALPGSKIVITEAGWPSVASNLGDRVSEKKQEVYYNEMMAWANKMNITTFFFEAFDENWKGDINNPLGAEKHWGLFTVDRKPKQVMSDFYSNYKLKQ